MKKRHICTYFDINFLPRGLALYESIKTHCVSFDFYVLALDDETYEYLNNLEEEHLKPIALNTYINYFEIDVNKYTDKKQFYFSITPNICLFLLQNHLSIDSLLYLDADVYLFNNLELVYQEVEGYSIGICPQRLHFIYGWLSKHYGIFNVGVNFFKNDIEGIKCLNDWKVDCDTWYQNKEGYTLHFFSDQIFLDNWPQRYNNLTIIKHIGINAAPWNLVNYKISLNEGKFYLNKKTLVIFHFSSLHKINKNTWNANTSQYFVNLFKHKKNIYIQYINQIESYGLENKQVVKLSHKIEGLKKILRYILSYFFNEKIELKDMDRI